MIQNAHSYIVRKIFFTSIFSILNFPTNSLNDLYFSLHDGDQVGYSLWRTFSGREVCQEQFVKLYEGADSLCLQSSIPKANLILKRHWKGSL